MSRITINHRRMQEAEIAYILKGYPRTSETFILNEIFLLEQMGLKLSIFSFKKPEAEKPHAVISKIKAPVIYLPQAPATAEEGNLFSSLRRNLPLFAASHRKLFRQRPWAYLGALFEALQLSVKYRRAAFIKEFLQAGFIALAVLEQGRIRHLHAHFCHASTDVAMLASQLCGLPFSFTAHAKDIYREDMNPGDLLPLKLRRARFAVTCTKANQIHLDRLRPPRTPLYTIYHGLDISLFAPAEKTRAVAKPPLILSVGRMVEKKGFPTLIEACRLLKDKGYAFDCRIIGGVEKQTEVIKNLIGKLGLEQTVTLHEAVTQEELRHIYEQATLFALPCQVIEDGDRDGIPNVLVEAMAMTLPVVSTNVSGIPELIQDRINGLLVPQKNAEALASAMEELLDNAGLRRQLGQAARHTVCKDFDARRNVVALKKLFDDCF